MDSKKEDNAVGLLATREFSTPLQIAEQSSTTGTHFEQTSSLADARLRCSQSPQIPSAATILGGGGKNKQ